MIKTDRKAFLTVKEKREQEQKKQAEELRAKCEALAIERYGEKQVKNWSNEFKGLWYLPIVDDAGNVEKMLVLTPINRAILSDATTKLQDSGLYVFLEQCMRDCLVAGDQEILDEDEYFIAAANKFNGILEGKKAALVKR